MNPSDTTSELHHSGDITFAVGPGACDPTTGRSSPCGSIIFQSRDVEGQVREVLRIDPNGTFYVEGRPAGSDPEIYHAFRAWIFSVKWTSDEHHKLQTSQEGTRTVVQAVPRGS